MTYELFHADCFDWLQAAEPLSVHAVVTDPPYGLVEFSDKERAILRNGDRGGNWRLPPSFDGSRRDPLPRFTTLSQNDKNQLQEFMRDWGKLIERILVPGAHVCIAGNPSLQFLIQNAMVEAGFEVRAAVMRLYVGFRGGDRPKLAEREFSDVCVTPRGCYEPWMLFRKPISERTVADNLRKWSTGGLRRLAGEKPLPDVIQSSRTPEVESAIADHPTIKPQHILRILVRAMLPRGVGVVLDPFAGSGSTIAAANAIGYDAIGIELDKYYFSESQRAVPLLSKLYPNMRGESLEGPTELEFNERRPKRRNGTTAQTTLL
jgi:site-specific DNA-methyltransferase (adenine-specific)